ncbi:unnamed protein product [Porites evermanni]|uniref:MIB/HERC2 domain-containing protein n=1 Tax=Porites evermanni TaxID=104178 RepID=A0ABN8M2U6_9CNID|nr:unnamed protein product [Porites evermanni]
MYVMVQNMHELSTFFRRQVLLSRFIAKFAHGENGKRCSCATMKLWMHLGGLLSTQEARRPLMALLLAMIVADSDSDDDDDSETYPNPPSVGTRIRRGSHWKWGDQDKNGPGTIVKTGSTPGWVDVEWDSGAKNSYRYGKDSAFDIRVVDENRRVIIDLEGI